MLYPSYSATTEEAAKRTGAEYNISARLRGLDTLMGNMGERNTRNNNTCSKSPSGALAIATTGIVSNGTNLQGGL
jgi:hypothetical protein